MNLKHLLLLAIISSLVSACGPKPANSDQTADTVKTVVAPPEPPVYKDSLLDFKARFIAALSQEDSNSYSRLEKDKNWIQYKTSVDTTWSRVSKTRLKNIQAWEDSVFSKSVADSLTLLYPFSGPDFLHAYYLYPRTREYILFALEPIIPVAPLDSLSDKARDKFLDSLNHSLRDVILKSYFITTHMMQDLKQVKGVLPPLYFFIERTGHELLEQHFITIDSLGNEVEVPVTKIYKNRTTAVKLKFRNIESRQIKTLYYIHTDLSNYGVKKKPELWKFLAKRGKVNTFVKSASYLMLNPQFTEIRDIILNSSQTLFQDDTGVPYKSLKNRMDFSVQLFGEYTRPVSDFGDYTIQKDLDSAYRVSKNKQKLPFSLGYHWSTKIYNYMLVTSSQQRMTKK